MRRLTLLFVLLATCCGTASAKPRHWFTDWKWYVGESVILGAMIADTQSTCAAYAHGLSEGGLVLHGNRSCGKTVAFMSVGMAAQTGVHVLAYKLFEHDPSKAWRTVSLVTVPAIVGAANGSAAIHNYEIIEKAR